MWNSLSALLHCSLVYDSQWPIVMFLWVIHGSGSKIRIRNLAPMIMLYSQRTHNGGRHANFMQNCALYVFADK